MGAAAGPDVTVPAIEHSVVARVARLRELDVCAVSDALDMLNRRGVTTVVSPMWPVTGVVAGVARTVQAGPRSPGGPADHIGAAAVDASGPVHVLIIANAGREDVSCWGGLLSQAARRNGIAGVVIDGACRDIAESEAVRFPVFARRAVPTSARGRIVQVSMDEPVDFAGLVIASGDYVIADRTGVTFISAEQIDHVLLLAERIAQREAAMSEQVTAGRPIRAVMHDSKFPTLDDRPSEGHR